MKFVAWENCRNPDDNLLVPRLRFVHHESHMAQWGDRDAYSGPQLWEASFQPLAPRSRFCIKIKLSIKIVLFSLHITADKLGMRKIDMMKLLTKISKWKNKTFLKQSPLKIHHHHHHRSPGRASASLGVLLQDPLSLATIHHCLTSALLVSSTTSSSLILIVLLATQIN